MQTHRVLAVAMSVVTAVVLAETPPAGAAPIWHKLSPAALEKTVQTPGWQPLELTAHSSVFRLPRQTCANWKSPSSLTAIGSANRPTRTSFQQVIVEVHQVSNRAQAIAAVSSRAHSDCLGTVRLTVGGLPKGAVAWSDAGLDVNVELAEGDAYIEAQVSPRLAFGKKSMAVLKHAFAVTVTAYRRAALR